MTCRLYRYLYANLLALFYKRKPLFAKSRNLRIAVAAAVVAITTALHDPLRMRIIFQHIKRLFRLAAIHCHKNHRITRSDPIRIPPPNSSKITSHSISVPLPSVPGVGRYFVDGNSNFDIRMPFLQIWRKVLLWFHTERGSITERAHGSNFSGTTLVRLPCSGADALPALCNRSNRRKRHALRFSVCSNILRFDADAPHRICPQIH